MTAIICVRGVWLLVEINGYHVAKLKFKVHTPVDLTLSDNERSITRSVVFTALLSQQEMVKTAHCC